MKQLLTFIFGQKAQGEKVSQPTFKTTEPTDRPSETDWTMLVAFGSRYGHRGSFYQSR